MVPVNLDVAGEEQRIFFAALVAFAGCPAEGGDLVKVDQGHPEAFLGQGGDEGQVVGATELQGDPGRVVLEEGGQEGFFFLLQSWGSGGCASGQGREGPGPGGLC